MTANIYSDPEKFGLKTVGTIDWREPNYSFDMTVVWVDKSKRLFWSDDSGCSCPIPFEYDDLSNISTGSITALRNHLLAQLDERKECWRYGDATLVEVQNLMTLARKAKEK